MDIETIDNDSLLVSYELFNEDNNMEEGDDEELVDHDIEKDSSDDELIIDVTDKNDSVIITPEKGMEFSTQDEAYVFYNKYAFKTGFGIRRSSTNTSRTDKNKTIGKIFVCNKEGQRKSLSMGIVDDNIQHSRNIRAGCKAMMKIILTNSDKWKVSKFVSEHSHDLSTPSKVLKHRSHKKIHRQKIVKKLITQLHSEGIPNASIAKVVNSFEVGTEHSITSQQVHDHLRVERKNNLGKHCANVIRYFLDKKAKDSTFYCSIELTDNYTLRSVFWADRRSQESYKKFNDVIIFDVTYRTNKFSLPFAPFTGINHHRQSSLFGCALLADETEDTFVWLFKEWLSCMGGISPGAIITDQDAAIGNAIAKVFPNTIHRYCSWHLDKNIGEHMGPMKVIHGVEFEEDFNRLRDSRSISEAEDGWKNFTKKYVLKEKSWLPKLWERRRSWIPCYLNDKFFAGARTSQRSESINSFFDTYVNAQTPLHEFVVQYDEALKSRRNAEADEDFKTLNSKPVLTLSWPLEEQAGKYYTRALFTIFKEQIRASKHYRAKKQDKKETLTSYIVGKPETEEKKCRKVLYDSREQTISCECKYFEGFGLLCRHALCVMWKKHLDKIPTRYILKRWTIDSRYQVKNDELANSTEASEVDCDLFWNIRHNYDKVLDAAYKFPLVAEKLNTFLTETLVEISSYTLPKEVDVVSQELNSQVNSTGPPITLSFSNLVPGINIRDPIEVSRHKGRPKTDSRFKSGLEVFQQGGIKKRACGNCGELGHYRTKCHNPKKKNLATNLKDSQTLPST